MADFVCRARFCAVEWKQGLSDYLGPMSRCRNWPSRESQHIFGQPRSDIRSLPAYSTAVKAMLSWEAAEEGEA
jgi:hypothetical protein